MKKGIDYPKILLSRSVPVFFCARYTVPKNCALEETRLLEVKLYDFVIREN